jgi:hypothetical protein
MRQLTFEPAQPLDTDGMAWIPTGPGKSFRPLRFAADGWSELMRLEPGSRKEPNRRLWPGRRHPPGPDHRKDTDRDRCCPHHARHVRIES